MTAQTVFVWSWRADEMKMWRYGSISVLLVFSSYVCKQRTPLEGCMALSNCQPSPLLRTNNNNAPVGLSLFYFLLFFLALAWVLELNTHLLSVALTTKTQRREKNALSADSAFFLFLG